MSSSSHHSPGRLDREAPEPVFFGLPADWQPGKALCCTQDCSSAAGALRRPHISRRPTPSCKSPATALLSLLY